MRITSNTLHERLIAELGRLSSEQSRLTQQLATGKKVQDASDNPALAGRVMNYSSEKRMLQQFDRNADRVSQGLAVGTAHLDAMRKLSAEAINIGPSAAMTGDPQQRQIYSRQINNLIEQTIGLANGQHNNNRLFGAAATDADPFTVARDVSGRVTTASYVGDAGASPLVNVGESARIAVGTSGTENTQISDFINNLVALRDAIEAGDETLIGTSQNAISDSQDAIVGMMAGMVISQTRIEMHRVQNTNRFNELAGLSSRETDANLAETIVRFQAVEKNYQSALAAGARAMQQSLLDFLR